MIEIERKFLVTSDAFIAESHDCFEIAQGYLNTDPQRNVRVRIKAGKGFLTVKGMGNENGTTRFEWEKEIPLAEARQLMELCEKGRIEKTRYLIRKGRHLFEVDIFEAENKGLVMAEIELTAEDEAFERPSWLGEEVTGNPKYYNAFLSRRPYAGW